MKADIRLDGNRFRVRTMYHPILADRFGQIPARQWHADTKEWSFPVVRDCLSMVCDVCGILPTMLPDGLRQVAAGLYEGQIQDELDMNRIDGHQFLTAPYQHQRRNLARLLQNNRWLLADEQGTGKTHAVCNRIRYLIHHTGKSNRILVVCPKSVISSWQKELLLHAGLDCDLAIGSRDSREAVICKGQQIVVTNYEAVLMTLEAFEARVWDFIVFDEIHKIKNLTAQVSKACRRLAEKASWVYGLSGTPATNGLQDWLGVLNAVHPRVLDCPTKTAFEQRYCLKGRLGGKEAGPMMVIGYRNVADLHQRVAQITSRVTKAEALDLPEKVFTAREVSLEGDQARIYRELRRDAVARLTYAQTEGTLTVRNVLTESLRLLQVVGGFVPDDDGRMHDIHPKAKMAALMDVLDEVGTRQVVIWCAFKAEVQHIAEQFNDSVVITGESTDAERRHALEAFQRGDTAHFVATAAAAGVGVNGLQVADTEVFYSRNYNLADYLQAQDRLHRLGQKNTVSVVKLIAARTVDEKVEAALETKKDMLEMMLGRPEDMI